MTSLMINPTHKSKASQKLYYKLVPELKEQASGTVIYWENCDEVDPKKAETIIRHTEERLGRTLSQLYF